MPPGAEIIVRDGQRLASWRNARGKPCTAEVRATPKGCRIATCSMYYRAGYKDGQGVSRTVPTGCRDESAARAVLVELERRAEMVRAGVLTVAEDAISDQRRAPVAHHFDAYLSSLAARGCTPKHCHSVKRRLTAVFTECRFRSLKDVKCEAVEAWLITGANLRRSARTKNTYTIAAKAFLNWAVQTERIMANPLMRIPRADENADRRRQPRAFSPDELVRLLDAARRRPLVEALKFNRGWRKGQRGARIRPETRTKFETLGRERALIYKTLFLTGLRLGELSAIRICDVVLDGEAPHIVLQARHEKNRQGSSIALRADLADNLRHWIGCRTGTEPLFAVSSNLVKVLDRDLRFAGIPKRDERNRTACVHSLRHTFATLLSRGGVTPRVAQAAMRHSSLDLTMSVYTDPKLLDVAGALGVLPELPLDGASLSPTGTDHLAP
jgi:integrase